MSKNSPLTSKISFFQTSIFSTINQSSKGKNVILSPFSIYKILSLTTNGARGAPQTQMLSILNSDLLSNLNSLNSKINDILKASESIQVANAIMTKIIPSKEFSSKADEYDTIIDKLESVEQVNNWVKKKTNEKIDSIIHKLESSTKILILNAVYFKGEWQQPFDPDATSKSDFYNFNNENNPKKVETMRQSWKYFYYENNDIQTVQLPYKKDGVSAIIILPKKNVDINSININDNLLTQININSNKIGLHLELPKFEIKFESSLVQTLKNMGMIYAFNNADFTGITDKNYLDIYINDIIHKAYLKVDEYGTEAAAITAEFIEDRCGPLEEETMIVNRPFYMAIINNLLPQHNQVLFIAKIEEI